MKKCSFTRLLSLMLSVVLFASSSLSVNATEALLTPDSQAETGSFETPEASEAEDSSEGDASDPDEDGKDSESDGQEESESEKSDDESESSQEDSETTDNTYSEDSITDEESENDKGDGAATEEEVEAVEAVEDESVLFGTESDYEYKTSILTGTTITKYTGNGPIGNVVIPSTLGGRPVRIIGERAFDSCKQIKSIKIPDTVYKIEHAAFDNCTGLTSIDIPNSVTTIESNAFSCCESLQSLVIPDSVTSIGWGMCWFCYKLSYVKLSNKIKTIESNCFEYCTSLKTITIPDSVTEIRDGAFRESALQSIVIPGSVSYIEGTVFEECESLTSIVVDGNNSAYDSRNGCNAVISKSNNVLIAGCKNSVIPGSVTAIGHSAFRGCTGLKSINIPGSVNTIGDEAFSRCHELESITIPNSVTTIGDHAFEGCGRLKSLDIPDSVTTIGRGAFSGCSELGSFRIPAYVKEIDSSVFSSCSSLKEITIPGSVTSIGDFAFDGCFSLVSITLPKSVTHIGERAFDYCESLQDVYYTGSEYDFANITIEEDNDCLKNARIHYEGSDRNRVLITPVNPENKTKTVKYKTFGGNTAFVDLKITFKTNVPVKSVNANVGSFRIVEYDTDKVIYRTSSYSGSSFRVKKSGSGSEISYIFMTDGMRDGTRYYIEIDKGFLTFEDGSKYAFLEKDDWTFKTASTAYYLEEGNTSLDRLLPYYFDVDDSYFLKSSYEYNYDLALIAYGLTLGAFEAHSNNNYTRGYKNIQKTFDNFGFSNFAYNDGYTKKPTANSIGVSAATKIVNDGSKNYTVIALPIRGAGYEAEWAGNVTVGKDSYHQGFKTAADQVIDFLKNYINSRNITGDVKIIVTGYSRAAGTANIVASLLDDGALNGMSQIRLSGENIYGFCFEPPAVTTKGDSKNSRYQNITSFINSKDIVPKVPAKDWNFKRFGREYYFNDVYATESFRRTYNEFLNNYKSFRSVDYVESTFKPVGRYATSDMAYWLTCFVTELCTSISRDEYVNNMQGDAYDLLKNGLGTAADDALKKYGINSDDSTGVLLLKIFIQLILHKSYLSSQEFLLHFSDAGILDYTAYGQYRGYQNLKETFAGNNRNGELIIQEHYPLVNFAWLLACRDKSYFSYGTYKYAYVNCPVDVKLYDSETGELSAEIVGDVPNEVEGSPVSAFVDANGQKVFILPTDRSYEIKITATDAGEVNYSIVEGNESEGITNRTDYLNIEVEPGDEISGSVGEDGSSALSMDGNACSSESTTDIVYNEVTLTAGENGDTVGSGSYMKHDFVIAHAVPNPGAEFDGWYDTNGNLISEEEDYRFRVDGDTEYTARFKEKDGLSVVVEDCLTYTGAAQKPSVKVYDGLNELTAGTDYTVSYKNNKNVYTLTEGQDGFDPSKAPCVTVKGKGNYNGKDTAYFVISPRAIDGKDTQVKAIADIKEDGKAKKPVPVVSIGKTRLKAGTDFDVTYLTEDGASAECKAAGNYIARVTGKGNYTGSIDCKFVIYSNKSVLISKVKMQKIPDSVYDSKARDLSTDVKLSYNNKDLEEGTDYEIFYNDDHTTVGKKSITIAGLNDFTGSRTVTYNIKGRSINKAGVSGIEAAYGYTGDEIEVPVVVTFTQGSGKNKTSDNLTENEDYTIDYTDNVLPGTAKLTITGIGLYSGTIVKTFRISGGSIKNAVITGFNPSVDYTGEEIIQNASLTVNGRELVPGSDADDQNADYIAVYSRHIDAGTATVTYKGINGYTGSVQKKFTIKKKTLSENDFEISVSDAPYKKGGSTPEVTLKFKGTDSYLDPKLDYKVSYKNNKAVTTDATSNKPVVTVTGKGNFTGSISKAFAITPSDMSVEDITMSAKDVIASGKPGKWKSVPVITDSDGKVLKAGTDYEKKLHYYVDGTEILLSDGEIVDAGTTIRVVAIGKGAYTNSCETTYNVVSKDISKAKVNVKAKTYTGKEVWLSPDDIELTYNGEKLTEADYTIDTSTYKNHIKKGKATVVIRGKGDYGNAKTITFTIGAKGILWWFRNLMQ